MNFEGVCIYCDVIQVTAKKSIQKENYNIIASINVNEGVSLFLRRI